VGKNVKREHINYFSEKRKRRDKLQRKNGDRERCIRIKLMSTFLLSDEIESGGETDKSFQREE
jgi:hypothetical protein